MKIFLTSFFRYIFIVYALVYFTPMLSYAQEEDHPISQVVNTEDRLAFNSKLDEFINEAREKNNALRQSRMDWSLAALGIVVTLVAISLANTIITSHSNRQKVREAEKILEGYEKRLEENKKKLEEIEEMIELLKKDSMGGVLSKLTQDELAAFKEGRHLDIILKTKSDFNQCKFSPCGQCKVNVFSNLSEMYKKAVASDKDTSIVEVDYILDILGKMKNDIRYENCKFKINHFMGYIYSNDLYNKNGDKEKLKNKYEKTRECYEECLSLDKHEGEKFLFVIFNDLGYAEMRIADLETNKKIRQQLYETARSKFEQSIDILKEKELKWANPYKNMGKCLGKLALLEKDNEKQIDLLVQAETWYHMAYSTNIILKHFELINKSFIETRKEYYKFIFTHP